MNTVKQNSEKEVVVKGQLIAVLNHDDSFRYVAEVINHKDSFHWLFITDNAKTVYKSDVLKLPIEEFPVTVIDAGVIIN